MKKIMLGQIPVKWTTLTMYTYDDGENVDVVCDVSDGKKTEWMDSKYDSFYKKAIWPHQERLQHTKENALKAYGYLPAQMIIMECDFSEFRNLR